MSKEQIEFLRELKDLFVKYNAGIGFNQKDEIDTIFILLRKNAPIEFEYCTYINKNDLKGLLSFWED